MPQGPVPHDWSPDTEEGYEVARSYLKERFASWCAGKGIEPGGDPGEALVHYKWGYLGGNLTRWTCEDLDQLYLAIYPAKVVADEDELAEVLVEAKAFVTFLAETGLLDPDSDPCDVLAAHIDQIEVRFRANMADVTHYSPGKRLVMSAHAEGISLDDEDSLQSFIKAFNARPFAERDRVLGPSLARTPRKSANGRCTPAGTPPRPRRSSSSRKRRGR